MNDVMVRTEAELPNYREMLHEAIRDKASLEVLTKIMDLQERWERNTARKAYENAIADLRAELRPIAKNRRGNYGNYADMAGIASEIDETIAKHGLSYRFRSDAEGNRVTVTCIVSHRDGYSEENSVPGPVDTSGSKNAIQGIGSTLTYLQRYTLTMALGLSFENNPDDDDGAKGVSRPIAEPKKTGRIADDLIAEMRQMVVTDDPDKALQKLEAFGKGNARFKALSQAEKREVVGEWDKLKAECVLAILPKGAKPPAQSISERAIELREMTKPQATYAAHLLERMAEVLQIDKEGNTVFFEAEWIEQLDAELQGGCKTAENLAALKEHYLLAGKAHASPEIWQDAVKAYKAAYKRITGKEWQAQK